MSEETPTETTEQTATDATGAGESTESNSGQDVALQTESDGQPTPAERAAFEALGENKTIDEARKEADSATNPEAGEQAEEETGEGQQPTPTTAQPLDATTTNLLKRWSFDEAGIKLVESLPPEQRAQYLDGLQKRTAWADNIVRENAELKQKLGTGATRTEQDATPPPSKASPAEDALLQRLEEHFGSDGAKATLEVAKALAESQTATLRQEISAIQAQAIAPIFEQHSKAGFEAATKLVPNLKLDDAARESVIGHAIEILKSDRARGVTHTNLTHSIPIAIQQLYATDVQKAAVQKIATSARTAVQRTPGRAPSTGRNVQTPTPQEQVDDEAFSALARGIDPNTFRKTKGLATL
jgi:hypothetical protein